MEYFIATVLMRDKFGGESDNEFIVGDQNEELAKEQVLHQLKVNWIHMFEKMYDIKMLNVTENISKGFVILPHLGYSEYMKEKT